MHGLNFVLATTAVGAGIGGFMQWQGSQGLKRNLDPNTGIKVDKLEIPYVLAGALGGFVGGAVLGLGWGGLKGMGHFAKHHPFVAAGTTAVVVVGLALFLLAGDE